MSFVGGGSECATGANVVSQFNKHADQDRSLQRQAAHKPGFIQGDRFKNEHAMGLKERQQLDQFMTNDKEGVYQFQPMRHELNSIQMQQGPAMQNWSNEFQSHSPIPMTKNVQSFQTREGSSQWAGEFLNYSAKGMEPQVNNAAQFKSYGMGIGYRPMMGGGMMGSSLHQQPRAMNSKQNEQQLNWDDQFKQIEELDSETKVTEEEETITVKDAESSDFVIDDKYQASFQEVWDSLNSEAVENDFISQQYEEYKSTISDQAPADMSQWERDFARYALSRAQFGGYKFEEKNQFLDLPGDQDPYEIGLQLMENGAKLSEAALAFEAAIKKDQDHVNAWLKLGEVQTQNEKELAGISALERCLELHPENLDALMTLAISYINEGYDNAAFATLERWLATKYPQIIESASQRNPEIVDEDRFTLGNRVKELFLSAAQLSPDQANLDPDVQMGLGVLFYANEEFDKTIDCFRAALNIKPDDAVLWNRLGAALANSSRLEEAVDAYFNALERKPTFVRARYNLGVSCINIGCYKEAAEHLLCGLSMHRVEGEDTSSTLTHNQSSSLLETLKRAFIALDRRDLVDKVRPGMDLNQFRDEFTF